MRLSPLLKKFAVLCISLCGSIQAWSHAKTDLITVTNGDQITGAVNAMSAGKLSVSTSYAGTVNIKWREIKQIESRYLYEIRLDDGRGNHGNGCCTYGRHDDWNLCFWTKRTLKYKQKYEGFRN